MRDATTNSTVHIYIAVYHFKLAISCPPSVIKVYRIALNYSVVYVASCKYSVSTVNVPYLNTKNQYKMAVLGIEIFL